MPLHATAGASFRLMRRTAAAKTGRNRVADDLPWLTSAVVSPQPGCQKACQACNTLQNVAGHDSHAQGKPHDPLETIATAAGER